jgi:hypothetical protein
MKLLRFLAAILGFGVLHTSPSRRFVESPRRIDNCLNPFKTGPSGEPIKNGLLGRFPTFGKDDSDVEYRRPPPSPPPPGPAGFEIVGDLFSAFLQLR